MARGAYDVGNAKLGCGKITICPIEWWNILKGLNSLRVYNLLWHSNSNLSSQNLQAHQHITKRMLLNMSFICD